MIVPLVTVERPELWIWILKVPATEYETVQVATPLTTVFAPPPVSVPPPLERLRVMLVELLVVTTFPYVSYRDAVTVNAAPWTTDVGGAGVNTIDVATPGVMLKLDETPAVSAPSVAVSVYPVPVTWIEQPLKLATPATAATVRLLQARVPGPPTVGVPAVMEMVTLEVFPVTVLPPASWTVTLGAKVAVALVLTGWVVNATFAGTPTVMLNVEEVAEVNEPSVAVSV